MGWLPSILALVVGVVLLVVLVLVLLLLVRPAHRARAAADALNVAVVGRTMRIRAGVAELKTWRATHCRARGPHADA